MSEVSICAMFFNFVIDRLNQCSFSEQNLVSYCSSGVSHIIIHEYSSREFFTFIIIFQFEAGKFFQIKIYNIHLLFLLLGLINLPSKLKSKIA